MDELIHFLLQYGHLTQQQIGLIKEKFVYKEIAKNAYYHQAGKIPKEVIFISEGIMRVCYYNNKGEEITKHFVGSNKLVTDIVNYNLGSPSAEYIQAVTDCKYLAISKSAVEELSQTIIIWDAMFSKIITKGIAEKTNRISHMISEDATERYLNFLANFPNMANQIPLSYIASYLGITQSSLSRIRKNIG